MNELFIVAARAADVLALSTALAGTGAARRDGI